MRFLYKSYADRLGEGGGRGVTVGRHRWHMIERTFAASEYKVRKHREGSFNCFMTTLLEHFPPCGGVVAFAMQSDPMDA